MNLAHAATTAAPAPQSFNAIDSMLSASLTVQITLLILISMSVVSWAIIFTKRKGLEHTKAANGPFLDLFWRANSLDDIFTSIDKHPESSVARVFRSGYLELRKMAESSLAQGGKDPGAPLLSGIDNLERSLRKAIDAE